MSPDFLIGPLGSDHDRAAFACGNAGLDDFIRARARKEVALGYCAVFVLAERTVPGRIAGYYSLSAHTIALDGIDERARRKLPRYPDVPSILIGRLARDIQFRGTGAGGILLLDALRRAWQNAQQIGAHAVTVDAIDGTAAAFYVRFGFIPVAGHANRFYLPMATIAQLSACSAASPVATNDPPPGQP